MVYKVINDSIRDKIMRFNIKTLALTTILLIVGCENIMDDASGLSDAEIVQMIRDAAKVEVTMSSIPSQSQSTIENDYYDYLDMATWKASRLGYQVELAGRGHRSGKRNEAYFNLEGRKLNPNDWGREGSSKDINELDDWQCFDIIFPITFEMPDGSIITIESDDEDQWSIIKSWYNENQDSDEKPVMQYPVVIFLDDESITINDDDELKSAYGACYSERRAGHHRNRNRNCFELVYPITFIMPDSSSITVNLDNEEGWEMLKSWYDENSGYEEVMPEFQYPIQIIYETQDGDSTADINSDAEMITAKSECREYWEEDYDRECFELVLPIIFNMPDGSTITVVDDDGYMAIRNWYVDNDGYDDVEPQLQYPVEIIYQTEDGDSTFTINSDAEMLEAKEECWEDNE